MTEVPQGSYTITMTATIYSGTNFQQMTHDISITFVDPCPSTVPNGFWPILSPFFQYEIAEPQLEDYASMTDTASYSHGNRDGLSFCGPRTYTLQTPFPWANFDYTSGQIRV